jgi:hypothetical protein
MKETTNQYEELIANFVEGEGQPDLAQRIRDGEYCGDEAEKRALLPTASLEQLIGMWKKTSRYIAPSQYGIAQAYRRCADELAACLSLRPRGAGDTKMMCAICREDVDLVEAESHLAMRHPAPTGGFLFFHDARPFRTEHPSMLVWELKRFVRATNMYPLYQQHAGGDVGLNDGQAVDLTQEPRFYSLPPATY